VAVVLISDFRELVDVLVYPIPLLYVAAISLLLYCNHTTLQLLPHGEHVA
jgi:hypothetical protein